MSPEQAGGELDRLGPATDVYSLGATLYCLLTGRPPFEGADRSAIRQAVLRGTFPPPRSLDPAIAPPLEAICLKAMAREPRDRYASPKALAEDVERWLADEPVTAWREPLAARARRWMRRHRTPVLAGAAVMVVALIGSIAIAVIKAEDNRRLAISLARERDAIKAYRQISDALLQANSELAPELLKEEALRSARGALSVVEVLARDQPGEVELRSAVAAGHDIVGLLGLETAGAIWQAGGAERRLEEVLQSHRRALALFEALVRERPADAGMRAALAWAYNHLGRFHRTTERPDEALSAYRKAQALFEDLAIEHPADDDFRISLAMVHQYLGLSYLDKDQSDQALASFRRVLAIKEELVRDRPDDLESALGLGRSYCELGETLAQEGVPVPLVEWHSRAVEILRAAIRIAEGRPQKRPASEPPRPVGAIAPIRRLLGSVPPEDRARKYLRNAYWMRAEARAHSGLDAAAVADWDEAFRLDRGGDLRDDPSLRLEQTFALARAGNYVRATAEVDAMTARAEATLGRSYYNAACAYSLASPAARIDAALSESDRGASAERYAAGAVSRLARARAAGWFDAPEQLEHLKSDPDLHPLRSRPDFRAFLEDLAFPREPFAR